MTLFEAEKNKKYILTGIYLESDITRRLESLGLNEGTSLEVLNRKKKGAMVIRVRGTRLAMGKHITSNIEVYQEMMEGE